MSQVAKNQVVQVQAISNGNNQIVLKWNADPTFSGNYLIYSRNGAEDSIEQFQLLSTVAGTQSQFTIDNHANQREYLIAKSLNNQTQALGYIWVGNKYKPQFRKGHLILLVDSIIHENLKSEIYEYKTDLMASGWKVTQLISKASESPEKVKEKIKNIYDISTPKPRSLFILGHVPVPYSGYFSANGSRVPPDGHVEGSGNHTGAWPADLYYGDFTGFWTDYMVECKTGQSSRLYNIPKDGKFDQSVVPGYVELEIGRADFSNLPAFADNEIELTRQYLNRVHDFKSGMTQFVDRALLDDNFTTLNLASTGYQNFPCFVGLDSVINNRDYFTSQTAESYRWSYGCGAGSFTSCNGIGTTSNFVSAKGSFKNAFTLLAGSYFGDWDVSNNLLRSSLASGSLATAWGGIPKWYFHHMALGKHIGYAAKLTQNNEDDYFNGAFNQSSKGVFIALLGDPTLPMKPVEMVSNVKAKSVNGNVLLSWNHAKNKGVYYVYRIDTLNFKYELINQGCGGSSSTTDSFIVDNCNFKTGNYIYGVGNEILVTTGSGTSFNHSMLALSKLAHVNSAVDIALSAELWPNPSNGNFSVKFSQKQIIKSAKLFNLQGQLLEVMDLEKVKSVNSNEYIFELNSSIKGMYYLQLQSENGISILEIILN
jgi:hypothetical protein